MILVSKFNNIEIYNILCVFFKQVGALFVCVLGCLLVSYVFHCTWVTSEAYSSPSIVLSARSHDGARIIFDDFREAYTWLKMNTAEVFINYFNIIYIL